MKRPTLTAALATKGPELVHPAPAPATRAADTRINTTLRLPPETLETLKIIAHRRRVRVNDLVLEGVAHVIAVHSDTLRAQQPAA